MSKGLGQVLKNGAPDLVAALLNRNQLPCEPPPAKPKLRGHWVGALLLNLRSQADARLAALSEDARRILSLSEARFDWLFVRTAMPETDAAWLKFDSLNRSLWFLLFDESTFEQIERRGSYERFTSQKNRHTQFCIPPGISLSANQEAIGKFEQAVQALYRRHDGSGLYAETAPDDSLTPNGDALYLITVSLSQLPASQAEFSNDGKLDTRPVQRVTEVQASYEPATGDLYVTTTRGGYPMRFEVATLFAELVLGLKEAPAVAEADQFDLGAIVATTELPAVPGFEFSELYLAEAEFCHPDRSSTVVSLRDGEGIDAALIKAFCPAGTQLRILSLTYRILCQPAGTRKAKWIRLKLNEDGSTSLKGDVKLDYELREKIPELWGLRQPGND